MGYNSKVTKHNYGISGRSSLENSSNGIYARQFMESKNRREQQAVLEASIQERDNIVKQAGLMESINARKVGDRQASFIMNDMTKEGKDYVFKYAMGVIFENCLLLDDYYVAENSSKIRSVMERYIDQNGGIAILENALKTNKTRFLSMLMETCNKTASKCAKRKVKEAEEAGQTTGIKFDMTDEEREELDTEISAMDIEQLSSVVKDKVLTVIKDEKERAQQREEFEKELADGTEDAIVKEQTYNANYKYSSAKNTLFNALMTESYKDVLETIVQFNFDSSDEVDEIGIDKDDVDYDDDKEHSLSELNKDGDLSDIPDEYDDSLDLGGVDEIVNESFMDTISVYDKFFVKTMKNNNTKQQAANFKLYSKKSREELEKIKAKKLDKLDKFKETISEYDDTSKISQGAKNILQLSLTPGLMSFLPAHMQSKLYLEYSIWLAEEEIKTLNKVISTKNSVKESVLDLVSEYDIQLEGFNTFERVEVIGLCQRNSLDVLLEASLESEELVYSLESKLAMEKAKSDEEKERELEDAEATYGASLAKDYVGETKIISDLETARKRHKCIEKAIELKPEIPECEDETEESLVRTHPRKMSRRRKSKVTKKALVMDQVMAEALTKYTLLETLYTAKLENYTMRDVIDLSVRLTSEK